VEPLSTGWRKSSYSTNGGQNCLEAASAPGAVLVRDSKDEGNGPVLRLTAGDWARLTRSIR
jgi:hypothetical protein